MGEGSKDSTAGQMGGVRVMRKGKWTAGRAAVGQPTEATRLPRVGWPFRHPIRSARALLSHS